MGGVRVATVDSCIFGIPFGIPHDNSLINYTHVLLLKPYIQFTELSPIHRLKNVFHSKYSPPPNPGPIYGIVIYPYRPTSIHLLHLLHSTVVGSGKKIQTCIGSATKNNYGGARCNITYAYVMY